MSEKSDNAEMILPPGVVKGAVRDNVEVIIFAMVLVMFFKTFVGQQFTIPSPSMRHTLMIGDHLLVNKFIFATPQWGWEEKLFPMRQVERGDIIVFRFPMNRDQDYVKRCVAKEGDEIEVRSKHLYVNGKLVTGEWEHHCLTEEMVPSESDGQPIHKYPPTSGPWFEGQNMGTMEESNPDLWPYIDPVVYSANQQGGTDMDLKRNYRDNLPKIRVPKGYVFAMGDNRDHSADSRYWGFLPMDHLRGRPFIVWWSFREGGNDETNAKVPQGPTDVAMNFWDGARHFWVWSRWDRTGYIPR